MTWRRRDGADLELPSSPTKRDIFKWCGRIIGHYPVCGWLWPACSYLKRLAGYGTDWDGPVPVPVVEFCCELKKRLDSADPVRGTYFLNKLLKEVKPERLIVISNSSPDQYRQEGMTLKHYSTMPECVEDMDIQPRSYVIIDDIRVMALKNGSQRECLYKFFTMYSHHYKLNVFFLSQSFDNIKDMKIIANFLYLFRFTDKANIERYINTLFGGQCIKSSLIYKLYEKLLAACQRPVLAIDCSRNQYFTYCNEDTLKVKFE